MKLKEKEIFPMTFFRKSHIYKYIQLLYGIQTVYTLTLKNTPYMQSYLIIGLSGCKPCENLA